MPLPLRKQHRRLLPPQYISNPPPQLCHHIRQQFVPAARDKALLQHSFQAGPPALRGRGGDGVVVGVAVPGRVVAAAEEGGAPRGADGGRDAVFAGVAFHARPVEVEARPGGQQDGGAEPLATIIEAERFDFRVRVQDVGEDAEGEIGACGVAGEDDGFGCAVQGGEGVAEEGDALLELARVDGLRGEGVGEHEGGDGGGGEGADEVEVALSDRDVVAAAWGKVV